MFLNEEYVRNYPRGSGITGRLYIGNPDNQTVVQVKNCLEQALPGLTITPVVTTDERTRLRNTLFEGTYNVTYDLVPPEMAIKINSDFLIALSKAINDFITIRKIDEGEDYYNFPPRGRVTNFNHEETSAKRTLTRLILYPYFAEKIAQDPQLAKALRDDPKVKAALKPIQDTLHAAHGASHSSKVEPHDPKRRNSPSASRTL